MNEEVKPKLAKSKPQTLQQAKKDLKHIFAKYHEE